MSPDLETLSRAAQGERAAFDAIYARLGHGLFVFLAGLLGRREDAEDALQATLLRAWVWLPSLKRRDRFVPWIFRIARNVASDAARRRARLPRELRTPDDLLGPDPAAPQESDEVRALVAGLRGKTRALVLLRAVEGLTAEEVGVALGSSAATVRRRYARALEQLRRGLKSTGAPR